MGQKKRYQQNLCSRVQNQHGGGGSGGGKFCGREFALLALLVVTKQKAGSMVDERYIIRDPIRLS